MFFWTPSVDEDALLESLKNNTLRGAALDVFATEPLPSDHEFWEMENVLISPHNMDKTATFMHEASEFFVNENLPRFILGDILLNPVDASLGYWVAHFCIEDFVWKSAFEAWRIRTCVDFKTSKSDSGSHKYKEKE
jgi:hypothetical protein